jgi:hypothetical protein
MELKVEQARNQNPIRLMRIRDRFSKEEYYFDTMNFDNGRWIKIVEEYCAVPLKTTSAGKADIAAAILKGHSRFQETSYLLFPGLPIGSSPLCSTADLASPETSTSTQPGFGQPTG